MAQGRNELVADLGSRLYAAMVLDDIRPAIGWATYRRARKLIRMVETPKSIRYGQLDIVVLSILANLSWQLAVKAPELDLVDGIQAELDRCQTFSKDILEFAPAAIPRPIFQRLTDPIFTEEKLRSVVLSERTSNGAALIYSNSKSRKARRSA